MTKKQRELRRSRNEIIDLNGNTIGADDLTDAPIALFIHGFTADASYLTALMRAFGKQGYNSIAYNYACSEGIDSAASILREIIADLDDLSNGKIRSNKIIIVAHSMGGLVARSLVLLNNGSDYVRLVTTLGTPHNGTLSDTAHLEWLVRWGEKTTQVMEGGFAPSCLSALQLMKKDGTPPLIDRLAASKIPSSVRFISVSGGLDELEFGRNPIINFLARRYLKKQFKDKRNDGLVPEESSDLTRLIDPPDKTLCQHHNSYKEYQKTNHSHLANSQAVALRLLTLIKNPEIRDSQ
jgi:pimeloyl-ACP methyl ester carboxylesterase